jgi:hypothetical protein
MKGKVKKYRLAGRGPVEKVTPGGISGLSSFFARFLIC